MYASASPIGSKPVPRRGEGASSEFWGDFDLIGVNQEAERTTRVIKSLFLIGNRQGQTFSSGSRRHFGYERVKNCRFIYQKPVVNN